MTRLLKDDTLRTAPTPNPALWSQYGPGSFSPKEELGWWDFSTLTSTYARHVTYRQTANPTDQGILILVTRAASSGGARMRVWLSHSGATTGATGEDATSGFNLAIDQAGGVQLVQITSNATKTGIGAAIASKIAANTSTWVRLERTAGVVRCRIWADGSAEPSTWDYSVTDPGTTGTGGVPAGTAGVSYYRSPTTSTVMKAGKVQIYTPAGGFPTPKTCKLLTRPDGSRLPFGRHFQSYRDDCTDSAPSWLTVTGTGALDVPNGTRTITAAAGATAGIAALALAGDALALTVHNARLSDDANTSVALRFTPDGGTTVYELRHNTGDSTAKLVIGATTQSINWQWRSNGEGPRHRTATLMLVPTMNVLQMIALEGEWRDGTVIGWAAIPNTVLRTTAMTGSLQVTAGTGSQSVGYTGLTLEAQRL